MKPMPSGVDLLRTLFGALGAGRQQPATVDDLTPAGGDGLQTLFQAIGAAQPQQQTQAERDAQAQQFLDRWQLDPNNLGGSLLNKAVAFGEAPIAATDVLQDMAVQNMRQGADLFSGDPQRIARAASTAQQPLDPMLQELFSSIGALRPYERQVMAEEFIADPGLAQVAELAAAFMDPFGADAGMDMQQAARAIQAGDAAQMARLLEASPELAMLPFMRRAFAKKLPHEGITRDLTDPARLVPGNRRLDTTHAVDRAGLTRGINTVTDENLHPTIDQDVFDALMDVREQMKGSFNYDSMEWEKFALEEIIDEVAQATGRTPAELEDAFSRAFPSAVRQEGALAGTPAQVVGQHSVAVSYPNSPSIGNRQSPIFRRISDDARAWFEDNGHAVPDEPRDWDALISGAGAGQEATAHQTYHQMRARGMPEDEAKEIFWRQGIQIEDIEPEMMVLYHMTKGPGDFKDYDMSRLGATTDAFTHGHVAFLTDNPNIMHIENASTIQPDGSVKIGKGYGDLPELEHTRIREMINNHALNKGMHSGYYTPADMVAELVNNGSWSKNATEELMARPQRELEAIFAEDILGYQMPEGYSLDPTRAPNYPEGARIKRYYITTQNPFYHAGPIPDDVWEDARHFFEPAGITREQLNKEMAKERTWGHDNGYIILRNVMFGGMDPQLALKPGRHMNRVDPQMEAQWADALNEYLQAKGYDSMVHVSNEGPGGLVYMAFNPEQMIDYTDYEAGIARATQTGDLQPGTPEWQQVAELAARRGRTYDEALGQANPPKPTATRPPNVDEGAWDLVSEYDNITPSFQNDLYGLLGNKSEATGDLQATYSLSSPQIDALYRSGSYQEAFAQMVDSGVNPADAKSILDEITYQAQQSAAIDQGW